VWYNGLLDAWMCGKCDLPAQGQARIYPKMCQCCPKCGTNCGYWNLPLVCGK